MNSKNREVFFNVIKAMATSGKLAGLLGAGGESGQCGIHSDFLPKLSELRNNKNLCVAESDLPETSSCSIM